jgi:DNA modification methylase
MATASPRVGAPTEKQTTPIPSHLAEAGVAHAPRGQQLALFCQPTNGEGQVAFRDPAFGENKNLPIHRWVPWIAGYSATFVDDVITTYLSPQRMARVLDPFCGSGTTLVQAMMHGHEAIGFEINPYAALAARAKISAFSVDREELATAIRTMQMEIAQWRQSAPPSHIAPPPLKSRLPFFSPPVERQVLHALAYINSLQSAVVADLFRAAFGAVMVGFSNYSYEPSLGSRPAAGKSLIEDADVARVLLHKLSQMEADIAWLQQEMGMRPRQGIGSVVNRDFFAGQHHLPNASIDLMVTSPPYMNNYHYVRNTRPQLYWLDFISSPQEQRHLENSNFGQYWQTVRSGPPIALAFEHPDLEHVINRLRQTRTDKGAYGGPGWANYVTAYFNDCFRFVDALVRLLVPSGVAVVVIGNSIIQGINIETERILGEIGVQRGLTLEGVYVIREKRVGASITRSSVRRGTHSPATLAEFAVVFRKH